jgi:hypothetical protein
VSEIAFLISFSDCSFLVKKAISFCNLIFYPTTLLKVFIKSKSFLVELLGTFKYGIISSANRDNSFPAYTSSFLSVAIELWLRIKGQY